MRNSNLACSWKPVVAAEMAKAYFSKLMAFVSAARSKSTVFPPEGQTFTALCLTPLDNIKVVILGQVSHEPWASFVIWGPAVAVTAAACDVLLLHCAH